MIEKPEHRVCLSLGSNVQPEQNLPKAVEMLGQLVRVETISQAWETLPSGMSGANFVNATALVHTPLSRTLLKTLVLRRVEALLGRRRAFNKFSPRTIDIDILMFDGYLLDAKLWTHAYLAVPLAEILPDYAHLETRETVTQAAQRLAALTPVRLRPDIKI